MPTATAVSRSLGAKFDRSSSSPSRVKGFPIFRSGFKVSADALEADMVVVSYQFGDSLRHASAERRAAVEGEHIEGYKEHLEKKYQVDEVPGPGSVPSRILHVRDKKD